MNQLQLLQKQVELYEKIIKETNLKFIGSLQKGVAFEHEDVGITIEIKIAKDLNNFKERQKEEEEMLLGLGRYTKKENGLTVLVKTLEK